jgi:hypothetical protein
LYFGLVANPSSLRDRLTKRRILPVAIEAAPREFV